MTKPSPWQSMNSLALLLALSLLYGCGAVNKANSPSTQLSSNRSGGADFVSIFPKKAALHAGSSLQFAAMAFGPASPEHSGSSLLKPAPFEPANTDLEWLVNGVLGGNSASGTISRSGLYTAPQGVTSNAVVAVTVINKTDPTQASSAAVTVVPRPTTVTVTVSPNEARLAAGQVQQFTATVTGTTNSSINWVVNGKPGGDSSVGTISSAGLYTAPPVAPSSPLVTISAVSVYDAAASAAATVTIVSTLGNQVHNVQTYGATVNTGTDSTAAINSAIASCPAQGCTVYLPSGTYALKSRSTTIVINQAHINFACDPGAIIQAQTGFISPNWPELEIQGSASDVTVEGCLFDGNTISGRGVQVDSTAARIYLDHIESKNQTGNGVQGVLRTGGLWQITNSYFHDNAGGGLYDYAGSGGKPALRIDHNHFDALTQIAIGSSGDNYFEASNNLITNDTVVQGALYCYGCDNVDWQHNTFSEDGAAVHCDTCGGGTISFNTATNDSATGFPDFFVEVGSHFTIEGNVSTNKTGERGMVVGVGSGSQGPATLRTKVSSFDSTNAFRAGPNVSLSTDNSDKQEGSGSIVATASSSFTTGVLWYANFDKPQRFWQPYQEIWVKPVSGPVTAGQLQLCLSEQPNISTCDLSVALPALVPNIWFHAVIYGTGWEGAVAINGQDNSGFKSYGVRVTDSSPGLIVKFDDFENAVEEVDYVVRSNKIVNPNSACIGLGALQGGIVDSNYCENPTGGSRAGYVVENSQNIEFQNNRSNFSNKPGSVHLIVDASASIATVYVSNDESNAATMYRKTNGGQVVP